MTDRRTFLLTTPIYYVNDVPHVGHAYTTIAADTLTRARRLQGRDAFLLTGTDEHGQNIERIAREKGVPTQQYCDQIAAVFRQLWDRLDIRYDRFIRTTEDVHVRGVLKLWGRLIEAKCPDGRDAIYKGTYAGWYCPRCEAFKDEEELKQPGNLCAIHERPCEWTEEENFFFRLSAYEAWLREEIESGRLRIDPDARRNEVLGIIGQGLKDFSVSRARVRWGIPVPQRPDHVFYVWVDALSNYITALGYADDGPQYRKYWASDGAERFHLIGKDILRFHCLYWPALLQAAGVPPPNREYVQGWITKEGKKLSKTTGNVIDPQALVERYGPDPVRYFLLREGTYGQDWDFTDQAFVGRFNSDLANDLGNLVSRALTMVQRYRDGRVPPRGARVDVFEPAKVLASYEALDFAGALSLLWAAVSKLNQRIVAHAPWEMAKDPQKAPQLDSLLYDLLESVRLISLLVRPVMPRAAGRIFRMLGLPDREPGPEDLAWGRLEPGAALGTIEPLFPRIEKAADHAAEEKTVSDASPPVPDRIDIADFAKVELRAAIVTAAEKVEGSKKLVKLQVDLGTEKRQVVAGIAESYAPETLVGKKVVIVVNLKPAKLMGVESNGMVLAASVDGKAVLCTFDGDVPPGAKVK
ncbi:MAG TPA: methionine--tRNA ligase [Vicinamibacteria bacterium]